MENKTLAQIYLEQEQKEDKKRAREQGLEEVPLTDADYANFYAALHEDKDKDESRFKIVEGEE